MPRVLNGTSLKLSYIQMKMGRSVKLRSLLYTFDRSTYNGHLADRNTLPHAFGKFVKMDSPCDRQNNWATQSIFAFVDPNLGLIWDGDCRSRRVHSETRFANGRRKVYKKHKPKHRKFLFRGGWKLWNAEI